MQENDSLVSVLVVLVVMKLWICADSDRSRADLWEGKEDVQLHTQRKDSVPPWSSIVPSCLSHRACVAFAGHRILKESCWKISKMF